MLRSLGWGGQHSSHSSPHSLVSSRDDGRLTGPPSPLHRWGDHVSIPSSHYQSGWIVGTPRIPGTELRESQARQNSHHLHPPEQSPLPPELRPLLGEPPPTGVPLDPVVSLFLRREQREQRREQESSLAQRLRRFLRRKFFLFRRRSVPVPPVPLSPAAPPLPLLSPQCPDDADRAAEPGTGPPVPGAPGTGGGLCQLAWGGGGSARDQQWGPERTRALNTPNKCRFLSQKSSRASVSPMPQILPVTGPPTLCIPHPLHPFPSLPQLLLCSSSPATFPSWFIHPSLPCTPVPLCPFPLISHFPPNSIPLYTNLLDLFLHSSVIFPTHKRCPNTHSCLIFQFPHTQFPYTPISWICFCMPQLFSQTPTSPTSLAPILIPALHSTSPTPISPHPRTLCLSFTGTCSLHHTFSLSTPPYPTFPCTPVFPSPGASVSKTLQLPTAPVFAHTLKVALSNPSLLLSFFKICFWIQWIKTFGRNLPKIVKPREKKIPRGQEKAPSAPTQGTLGAGAWAGSKQAGFSVPHRPPAPRPGHPRRSNKPNPPPASPQIGGGWGEGRGRGRGGFQGSGAAS